uniref:Uncharacterized protein n=1 Tax=Anguilla anguilla TaxID=7936 RepID=A0A0E9PK72_ANGAN
MGLGQRSVCQ